MSVKSVRKICDTKRAIKKCHQYRERKNDTKIIKKRTKVLMSTFFRKNRPILEGTNDIKYKFLSHFGILKRSLNGSKFQFVQ